MAHDIVKESAFESLGLRERKIAKTKAMIAECFIGLMTEFGFHGFSVKELCVKADIAEATFYNYFPQKIDVLLFAITVRRFDIECRRIAFGACAPKGLDAIGLYVTELYAILCENPRLWFEVGSVLYRENVSFPTLTLGDKLLACGDIPGVVEYDFGDDTIYFFKQHLAQAKTDGVLPKHFDVDEGAAFIDALVFGAPVIFRADLKKAEAFLQKQIRRFCRQDG